MAKIKFSHRYKKMMFGAFGQIPRKAKLLEAIPCVIENLHQSFLKYDTRYMVKGEIYLEEERFYKLPKGPVLILIFDPFNTGLFTTIRRWTPQKEEYYRSKRGKVFDVVIEEREKKT